jgi:hypothetical protein
MYNTEETEANQQEDDEVYYGEPDLSGGIEGIDYIMENRVNSEDVMKKRRHRIEYMIFAT